LSPRRLYAELLALISSYTYAANTGRRPSRCVDLGPGDLPTPLALARWCGRVEAYDIDCSLSEVYSKAPRVEFGCADIGGLNLGESSASVVLAVNVLEHVDPLASAAASVARALEPGGVLVASVPSSSPYCRRAFTEDGTHRHLLTREGWAYLFEALGLERLEHAAEWAAWASKLSFLSGPAYMLRLSSRYSLAARASGALGLVAASLSRRRGFVNPCSELLVFTKPVMI